MYIYNMYKAIYNIYIYIYIYIKNETIILNFWMEAGGAVYSPSPPAPPADPRKKLCYLEACTDCTPYII